MRAQLPSLLLIHDALEHCAENCGGNLIPVKITAIQKRSAHLVIEIRKRKWASKKAAIDITELQKLLGKQGSFFPDLV
ncbi:hypothetical protein SDC9_90834 [bioreactor metagenome]|uniref:Uncharacterized protein n=1 Tax=bioreactor metagenome TaxID=1076179 RepID=A0A644ZTU1_9ZZZZ